MANITERCRMSEKEKYWKEFDVNGIQFFKIMLGDFREQLRLPKKFMTYFREKLSENIKLVGPSGHVWEAKLITDVGLDDVLLQSGWEKFVKDHFLEEYDFLVFKYNGESSFHVTIFDKTGCEREGSYFVKKHVSCSDDRCALMDKKRKTPMKITDKEFDHKNMKKGHFRKGEEGCSNRAAENSSNNTKRRKQRIRYTYVP